MSRKLIIVPKDKHAEDLLYYDKASDDQLYSLYLNEAFFYNLWDMSVFDDINQIADVNIDDFEDESIMDVKSIKYIISYLEEKQFPPKFKQDSQYFLQMFKLALNGGVGIYFYF
ncbi:hypothetical protein M2132_000513 [Dysgonomonas sp. PH5-45]|uniref:hypothetical protein n=1 Tax=unclassified Dysgonomonas TaxID=2630389 RepID=UPI002473DC85|nr:MULTISPECIES: hypothetical protein [unclassified Dysgonomonas]MDH6354186.1 hypothetical protein [Dysgonomonas sp. PH5-45]MDH6387087.1 hypothetical protein [Dysgonomonas sp. PH5-37]